MEKRDAADRALASSSGVPLALIAAFRKDHPQMFMTATVLPADDAGPRYQVKGEEAEVDGYSSARAEVVYRADGSRVTDEDEDEGEGGADADLPATIPWEALPEGIRRAASAAVPGGRCFEAYGPDEEERYYEVHLKKSSDLWVVDINPDGKVRRTHRRSGQG
jgi:hypothetical protein